jgi:hypothetical protein
MTTMADPNSLAGLAQQTLQQQQQEFLPDASGISLLEYVKPAHYTRQLEADYYIQDGINQRNRGLNPQPDRRNLSPPPMESMARLAPGAPQWASDTGPSWNPATGLDGMGNYGGPIGTSGPMGAGGGDRGNAANIANGWTQPPAGQPALQFFGGQNNAAPKQTTMQPTPFPSQDRWLPDGSGVLGVQQPASSPTLPPQIGQQKFGNSGIGSLGGGGQTNVSLNLQGSATMNPQGANQNRGYPGWDLGNAGASGAGASGQMSLAKGGAVPAPQGIASLKAAGAGIREIDIIKTYLIQLGAKPEQVPRMIEAVVKDGAKFSRVGNTMMSAKPIGQGAMQVYFYTASRMPEFMAEVKGFIDKLKQRGISVIYMNKEDQDIMQAIQAAGASVQQSDRPEFKIMAGI